MVDNKCRVVLDGPHGEMLTGQPMSRSHAMQSFDTAVDMYAADIRAGDVRVSVLDDAEYQKRGN